MFEYHKSLNKVKQNVVEDELTSAQHDQGVALLGKTLLIVNPVAQSGQGSKNGRDTYNILRNKYHQNVEMQYTQKEGHASQIVEENSHYDSIIAIGGDGVVHEVIQGLMRLKKEDRPKFGVIPVGSGNDFARSLGMNFNVVNAVEQLVNSYITVCDIGKCNDQYFGETLSFGLDAGIALATEDLRKKRGAKGFSLYFQAGIDQIIHHLDTYQFEAVLDEEIKIKSNCIMFAVQNGPTYGGGFKIAPNAIINDGLLDICYCEGNMPVAKSLLYFGLAGQGKHEIVPTIHQHTAKRVFITFDRDVPCQLDGEGYSSDHFDISLERAALKVFKFAK